MDSNLIGTSGFWAAPPDKPASHSLELLRNLGLGDRNHNKQDSAQFQHIETLHRWGCSFPNIGWRLLARPTGRGFLMLYSFELIPFFWLLDFLVYSAAAESPYDCRDQS